MNRPTILWVRWLCYLEFLFWGICRLVVILVPFHCLFSWIASFWWRCASLCLVLLELEICCLIVFTIQDLDAVEALIQGLVLFQGGVLMVFETPYRSFGSWKQLEIKDNLLGLIVLLFNLLQVSHDEHLISGSVDQLWVVSEGRVNPFSGTFQDYKKILQSK